MYDAVDDHEDDMRLETISRMDSRVRESFFDEIRLLMAEAEKHPDELANIAPDALDWMVSLWRQDPVRESCWDATLEAALATVALKDGTPPKVPDGWDRAALLWVWASLCAYDELNRQFEEAAFNRGSAQGTPRRSVRTAVQSVARVIETTHPGTMTPAERMMRDALRPFLAGWTRQQAGPPHSPLSEPLDTELLAAALLYSPGEFSLARWQRAVVTERLSTAAAACTRLVSSADEPERLRSIRSLLRAYDSMYFCLHGALPSHTFRPRAVPQTEGVQVASVIRTGSHEVFLPSSRNVGDLGADDHISMREVPLVLAAMRKMIRDSSRFPIDPSDARVRRTLRAIRRAEAKLASPCPSVDEVPFERSAPCVPTLIGVPRVVPPAIGFQSAPTRQEPVTLPKKAI